MNDSDILHFIKTREADEIESLFFQACKVREDYYGKSVYFRA